jgi:hypothetical protein
MAVPINAVDFARFNKLATALSKVEGELSIWTCKAKDGKTSVSLELRGEVDTTVVEEAFGR